MTYKNKLSYLISNGIALKQLSENLICHLRIIQRKVNKQTRTKLTQKYVNLKKQLDFEFMR